jgi:RHS repeat-associated protein
LCETRRIHGGPKGWPPAKRIAIRNVSSGIIDYYEEDMLGSSRTMVQAGQTSVCFDADFLPFGYEKDVTTTCSQNYKFEGKERDTETNNDDFGARYYSSQYGRWLSADWSSVPAPVPYANLTNPQTLNLYAMVSDNPESFADLDGHCGQITMPGAPAATKPCANPPNGPVKTGESPDQPKSTTQQAQQAPDLLQQVNQATAQKKQDLNNKQNPAPGSPEYVAAVSGKVTAEMNAGNKVIGAAAAIEALGVAAVVTTSATAEIAIQATGNALHATADVGRAVGAVAREASMRAGAAVDLNVPGGVVAATRFVQGLLGGPKSNPTSPAGIAGVGVREVYEVVKNLIP